MNENNICWWTTNCQAQYSLVYKGYLMCIILFYFTLWLRRTACVILIPQKGIEPRPPQWKHRVLTTGPPGNSLYFKYYFIFMITLWEMYYNLHFI